MKKVTRFIHRKSMIYKTKVEYGDYTMNHVQGCSHGCKYPCYAYLLKKRFGVISSYDDWIKPAIAENTLEILDVELPRLKDKINMIHLCFTTDPFMYGYNEIEELSLAAINKINSAGVRCSVLTKGILPYGLADLSCDNEYGITLISLNEKYRIEAEPGAAPYRERVYALKHLHDAGCKTWVSIEPYPTPNIIEQNLDDILRTVVFTDKIIFGRTNYNKRVTKYNDQKNFYNVQAEKVIKFCNKNGIDYHIKDGTLTEKQHK